MTFRAHASLLAALAVVAGCKSDETLTTTVTNTNALLTRYVAMGNSITAGYQSGGINDSTQRQSYAYLFAQAAGVPFYYPSLVMPGCPAPFSINATQTRVAGAAATGCNLRTPNNVPFLSNVAVPGVRMIDAANNFVLPVSASNQLTQFILGGRTQLKAMRDAQPTFVTIWLGNNDILGAFTSSANPGDSTLITPQAAFQAAAKAVFDTVDLVGAKAIVIGEQDVTNIPYASQGATYWCLKTGLCPGVAAAPLPPTFTVDNSCAPQAAVPTSRGDSILVPWTVGVTLISTAATGASTTLNCTVTQQVVTPAEFRALRAAVAGFNTYLSAQATARGYGYLDPNTLLTAARANPTLVAPFPTLPSAATGGNVLFGTWFSLDGVHPSRIAHRAFTDSLISTFNRKFGGTIPFIGP